jgi:hypothetical protein
VTSWTTFDDQSCFVFAAFALGDFVAGGDDAVAGGVGVLATGLGAEVSGFGFGLEAAAELLGVCGRLGAGGRRV